MDKINENLKNVAYATVGACHEINKKIKKSVENYAPIGKEVLDKQKIKNEELKKNKNVVDVKSDIVELKDVLEAIKKLSIDELIEVKDLVDELLKK